MQSFKLTLPNEATINGIHNLPAQSTTPLKYRPLVVGLHGGTYTSAYFDADAKHTASLSSNSLGVPFVAIDRPSYGESSSYYPIPDNSNFHHELGIWLHKYILPALWTEFGKPQGCNSIVISAHSLAAAGTIIAAALYAAETKSGAQPAYPLGGVIVSGWGTHLANPDFNPAAHQPPEQTHIEFPGSLKDTLMIPPGTADPEIYVQTDRLNRPMPVEEIGSMHEFWLKPEWRTQWTNNVEAPVMLALAGVDTLWLPSKEHLQAFAAEFSSSGRVDTSILPTAPHCLELSYWSQGWYARCFGFAVECASQVGFVADNKTES